MKLQLVAVGTKMPDWVQTGFTEYLRRFPKDMPFELIEIPAGKRGKNADIKRILDKEGEQMLAAALCEDPGFMRRQAQAHAMMETHRATTSLDAAGRLQVMTSTQVPFHVRRHLARLLGLPASRIRVLKPRVGGGFGQNGGGGHRDLPVGNVHDGQHVSG